ncbi:MAG: hypothetical protein JXQ87_19160 [Bacteroidia bacterium]
MRARRLIMLFIMPWIFQTVAGQSINFDSLFNIWQNENQSDSLRANAYLNYVYYKYTSAPDSYIVYGQKLYNFSSEKELDYGKHKAHYLMGHGYFVKGDLIRAQKHLQKSLDLASVKHPGTLTMLGFLKLSIGDSIQAVRYLRRALHFTKEQETSSAYLTNSTSNLATIYKGMGMLDSAMFLINEGLEYLKNSNEKNELKQITAEANVISNQASVYLLKRDYSKALNSAERSFALYEQFNPKAGGYVLSVKAEAHYGLGKFERSIESALKSLDFAISSNDNTYRYAPLRTLYKGYKQIGKLDKALQYHEELLKYRNHQNTNELAQKIMVSDFKNQLKHDSLENVANRLLVEKAFNEELRKKEKARNIAFVSGGLLLLIMIGVYSRLRFTRKAKAEIEKEKHRSDELLLNILPAEVAEELKQTGESQAQHFDQVSILFTDFKEFTQTAEKLSAKELVNEINTCFKAFDNICEKYGIEKIKTIGDSYMAASGLGRSSKEKVQGLKDAANLVLAALEMQEFMTTLNFKPETLNFSMRAGIHTGSVVAGIVGVKKFQYDIWGDTVNTASRMESHGEVGKVNISEATYELLIDEPDLAFEYRGRIEAKGKGDMQMYFVQEKYNPIYA